MPPRTRAAAADDAVDGEAEVPTEEAPRTFNLLEALTNSTQDDLDQIRDKIAEHEKSLEALRTVEKILDVKLNGKPEKQPRAPRKPKVDGQPVESNSEARRKAIQLFLHHNGAAKPAAIAQATNIPIGSISMYLDHAWFRKTPDGYANA